MCLVIHEEREKGSRNVTLFLLKNNNMKKIIFGILFMLGLSIAFMFFFKDTMKSDGFWFALAMQMIPISGLGVLIAILIKQRKK